MKLIIQVKKKIFFCQIKFGLVEIYPEIDFRLTDENINHIIKSADTNGDGMYKA